MVKLKWDEQQYASKFRDLITRIARKVIQEERPAERIGEVITWDNAKGTALVKFPGDTDAQAITVRCAQNMQPSLGRYSWTRPEGYTGNAVRVAGKPGHYYVAGYVRGGPGSILPGHIMLWAHAWPPPGWLLCDGAEISTTDYPALYEMIGNVYGGGADSFLLPNLSAVSLNVSGLAASVFVIKT